VLISTLLSLSLVNITYTYRWPSAALHASVCRCPLTSAITPRLYFNYTANKSNEKVKMAMARQTAKGNEVGGVQRVDGK